MQTRQLADVLGRVKHTAGVVLEDWPDEANFKEGLEHAIKLLGKCETELDRVADAHGESR